MINTTSAEHALPHAIGPEKSVLSSIFQDPERCLGIAEELGLGEDDFYHPSHRQIFISLRLRYSSAQTLDLVSVSQQFIDEGLMESIGGPGALTEIYTYATTSQSLRAHIELIQEKALRRAIIRNATEAIEQAYDTDTEATMLLEDMESKTLTIRSQRSMTDESIGMDELMRLCGDHYQKCREQGGFGIPTGFPDLDSRTGGLHPGDLIITAARPSVGKTALAMAFMEHQTTEKGIPALFFSTEMGRLSIGHRALAAHSRINLGRLVQGDKIDTKTLQAVGRSSSILKKTPLRVIDTPSMTAAAIRSRTRREVKKHGIKIVYIDYLQLLRGVNRSENENTLLRIGNALKILKLMARELEIPVVVLAQLGRVAEDKLCNQLNNAMIKDCGEVEQDADQIIMIGKVENDDECEYSVKRGLNVTKQRQGPTGCLPPVLFLRTSAKFTTI